MVYAKLADDEHLYICGHCHCNAAIVVLVELILPDRPFVIVQQYTTCSIMLFDYCVHHNLLDETPRPQVMLDH